MESRVHFLTKDYKIAALCDDYVSLFYTEEYCDCGEMELVLDEKSGYIPETDDPVLCGDRLVYVVDRVAREKDRGTVRIHGRGILSYLERCIVSGNGTVYSSPEALIERLVRSEAIFAVPGQLEYSLPSQSAAVNTALEEGDLFTTLKKLAVVCSRGLSLTYDFDRERFLFSVIGTRNRLMGESDDPVFLSEGFDTLGGVGYSFDLSRYINNVTVRGAERSDGTYYRVQVRAKECSFDDGYDDSLAPSRALFIKSSVGTGLYTTYGDDGSVSFDEEAYLDALRTVGKKELAARRPQREISAVLSPDAAKNVQLGDRCTFFSPDIPVEEACVVKKHWRISPTLREYGAVFSAVK